MIKDTYSKSSRISCTYLGNLHTEAKYTLSLIIFSCLIIKKFFNESTFALFMPRTNPLTSPALINIDFIGKGEQ